jgi:hypothetical protein
MPLLNTAGSALPAPTAAEVTRVLAQGKTVYLLGGTTAIPATIATQLTGTGYVVSRISGSDRYATAVAVADAMGDPSAFLRWAWAPDAVWPSRPGDLCITCESMARNRKTVCGSWSTD